MRGRLCTALLVLGLATAPLAARSEPAGVSVAPGDRYRLVVLTAQGLSFSLGERRASNAAPPAAEVRLARPLGRAPWLLPEVGLGFIVFPEAVPYVGLGLRAHPLPNVAGVRHLFVRGAVQTLAVVDGFDLAMGVELGASVERGRLVGLIAFGADRYFLGPRLLLLGRLGVGLTF